MLKMLVREEVTLPVCLNCVTRFYDNKIPLSYTPLVEVSLLSINMAAVATRA